MEKLPEFIMNHGFLFAMTLGVLALLLMDMFQGFSIKARLISPQETIRLINQENAIVLDLRDRAEFVRGHISGARHFPNNDLPRRLAELERDKDKPIILCCQTGGMSDAAATVLTKAGINNLYRLMEGVQGWKGSNLPLTKE